MFKFYDDICLSPPFSSFGATKQQTSGAIHTSASSSVSQILFTSFNGHSSFFVIGGNNGRKLKQRIRGYVMIKLQVCADTMVGNDMIRGISGGQRKRVTTGEMVKGPSGVLFMDEILTGLDNLTTYQIVNVVGRQFTFPMDDCDFTWPVTKKYTL